MPRRRPRQDATTPEVLQERHHVLAARAARVAQAGRRERTGTSEPECEVAKPSQAGRAHARSSSTRTILPSRSSSRTASGGQPRYAAASRRDGGATTSRMATSRSMAAARAGSGAAGRWPATATTSPSRRSVPDATSSARIASAPSDASLVAGARRPGAGSPAARARTSVSGIPVAPGSCGVTRGDRVVDGSRDRVPGVVSDADDGRWSTRRARHPGDPVEREERVGRRRVVARRDRGGQSGDPLGRLSTAGARGR